MIYEMLKSIVRVRVTSMFEQVRLTLAPVRVVARPAECESRAGQSSDATIHKMRCKVDAKLAARVGRSMRLPDGRRCRR